MIAITVKEKIFSEIQRMPFPGSTLMGEESLFGARNERGAALGQDDGNSLRRILKGRSTVRRENIAAGSGNASGSRQGST